MVQHLLVVDGRVAFDGLRHISATIAPREFLDRSRAVTYSGVLLRSMIDLEHNDYRLERWIALFLTLLFFLPFVAR